MCYMKRNLSVILSQEQAQQLDDLVADYNDEAERAGLPMKFTASDIVRLALVELALARKAKQERANQR